MNKLLVICALLCVLLYTSDCVEKNYSYKLRSVSVLFRHGDRYLLSGKESYPNDPYKNSSFLKSEPGLTCKGIERSYNLGAQLAKKYGFFLSFTPNNDTVQTFSTNKLRTKQTLEKVLLGLFGINYDKQIVNSKELYGFNTEHLLKENDNYKNELKKLQNIPEIIEENHKLKEFMKYLSDQVGEPINDTCGILKIYATYVTQFYLDMEKPDWLKDPNVPKQLLSGTMSCFNILNFTPQLRKIYAEEFIKILSTNMINIRQNKSENNILLFSGHDINIITALKILGMKSDWYPPYTSSLIFELYERTNEYFVKIVYYHGIPQKFMALKMPNCEKMCKLDKFLTIIQSNIAY